MDSTIQSFNNQGLQFVPLVIKMTNIEINCWVIIYLHNFTECDHKLQIPAQEKERKEKKKKKTVVEDYKLTNALGTGEKLLRKYMLSTERKIIRDFQWTCWTVAILCDRSGHTLSMELKKNKQYNEMRQKNNNYNYNNNCTGSLILRWPGVGQDYWIAVTYL